MPTRNIIYTIAMVLLFFSCEKASDSAASPAIGVGGSLAKFTLIGNYLYAVSSHYLYTVDISNPAHPLNVSQSTLNFDMETIYPYKNRLFIGSKTGIYIYSIDTASAPRLIGEAKHGRSCDPVVANDTVSYATLKSNSYCGPATSGLYVYNIKDENAPSLIKTIPINEPIGLGMSHTTLYVCCAGEGLKVYSIANAYDPEEVTTISGPHFTDIIPYNDLLIGWTDEGISLYDISQPLHPVFIKTIGN